MTNNAYTWSVAGIWRWVVHATLVACVTGAATGAEPAAYPYSDAELFDRGQMVDYSGEHLEAISFPVGGVGSGAVHIDGRGVRHSWMIFSRYWGGCVPPDKPLVRSNYFVRANERVPRDEPKVLPWYMSYVPDSYFAVRVARPGGKAMVRVLQTVAEGPFAPVGDLTIRAAYPLAWYTFHDDDLAAKVSMRVWNPLIPDDLKDSSIPCAIYNITLENPTDAPLEVAVLATQQNAVGFTGVGRTINGVNSGGPSGQINRVVRDHGATTLHMTSSIDKTNEGYGDLALATDSSDTTSNAAWYEPQRLYADFADDGRLDGVETAGPTSKGTVNGAIARSVTLEPGAKRTVTFVLSWYFPNARHAGDGKTNEHLGVWEGVGNQYANWWSSARAVADDVLARYSQLESRTLAYQRALYESNLPYWFLQRISSQVTPIRTRTVWWAGNGYFGGWEGMDAGAGSCPGNCSHVWQYAQTYARLFPELGRIMRQQDYAHPRPDGGLPFRQPSASCDPAGMTIPATDGQLGVILGTYREYLMSGDDAWLKKVWPSTRSAMQFVIDVWDADGDGALSGIQHTTLDCKVGGSTSWLGSMYLAALRACERMATTVGDDATAARYGAIQRSGSRVQQQTLFNGEYFAQHIEGDPDQLRDYYTDNGLRPQKRTNPAYIGGQNYYDGCLTDQLLGQWWADQLDLGSLYDPDTVRTALRAVYRYNYFPNFREFEGARVPWIDPGDGGMVILTMPHGPDPRLKGKKILGYNNCTLSGLEYAAAAAMIRAGLLREGFTVVKTVSDRYDGRLRTGLHKSAWGYSGNPFGDDESGKWYARAQSSWSLLLAAQGYIYDGPAGVIGFDPVWKPDDHRSFFTVASGFGVYAQQRGDRSLRATIDMRDGTLRVKRVVLHTAEAVRLSDATVTLAGRPLACERVTSGRRVELVLERPIDVTVADRLDVHLAW